MKFRWFISVYQLIIISGIRIADSDLQSLQSFLWVNKSFDGTKKTLIMTIKNNLLLLQLPNRFPAPTKNFSSIIHEEEKSKNNIRTRFQSKICCYIYSMVEGERKKWDRGDACREVVHKLVFICVRAVKRTSETYLHATPTNNTVFNQQTHHSGYFVVSTMDTRFSFSLMYQFTSISLKTTGCTVRIGKGMPRTSASISSCTNNFL